MEIDRREVLALLATPALLRGAARAEATVSDATTALLVIDVQNFYFEGGRVPLVGPVDASRQAAKLLERFRVLAWPVIHVQHLPKDVAAADPAIADPQYRFHPNVAPRAGEPLVGKHFANAFRDTGLLALVRERRVARLVIAGMQTHMCVEAASRAAADLGFGVTVVHDACATRALSFGGVEVPAPHVHAATLAALQSSYAKVVSTEEMLASIR